MKAWLGHHRHSFQLAFDRLLRTPVATLLTVLVLAVAIALPAGLYALLENIGTAASGNTPHAEITVFFKLDVPEAVARQASQAIQQRTDVASARFVSRDEALRRMQRLGLGDIAAGLPGNPLPHAVILTSRAASPEAQEALAEALRKRAGIDQIKLDSDWARRLSALLQLGERLVWLLTGLLGLALAAIIGNTIRLQIYAQRDEIEVARLIGATDRFIRRPFLYFGALQGLLGGLAAWGLLRLTQTLLQGQVADLAAAYGSQFTLSGLAWQEGLLLLALSGLLGLLGAVYAFAHTRHTLRLA